MDTYLPPNSPPPPSLAPIFAALGEPTRFAIIAQLARGPAAVTALAQPFAMAGPSFLKHLKVLQNAGLITSHKTGRVRMVALRPAALAQAESWLPQHRAVCARHLDALGGFLEKDA